MKKVERFIERKNFLYPTKVEYVAGEYCCNIAEGCVHGCKFPCYAYLLKNRYGKVKDYEDWTNPKLVLNWKEKLNEELARMEKKHQLPKLVHMSFATDPFQFQYEDLCAESLQCIHLLNKKGVRSSVLTKGNLPWELSQLSRSNEYGISLVSLSEEFRQKWEPNAAPISQRLSALYMLHRAGFRTWVSIEPYPTPNIINQDIRQILNEIRWVDKIVFGRWNYNSIIGQCAGYQQFYDEMAWTVIEFCKENGITYWIKEGTVVDHQMCSIIEPDLNAQCPTI